MKHGMRTFLWCAALALLVAVLILVNRPEEKSLPVGSGVGERLPDFRLTCVDGSEYRLSEQRGRVVVINVWATWCTPCVRELPLFDRLQREHPADVSVLALHAPPVTTDVGDYLSDYSWEIPFAVDEDGSVSELLNASTVLPQTVILSPEGVVTCSWVGAMDYEMLLDLVSAAKP